MERFLNLFYNKHTLQDTLIAKISGPEQPEEIVSEGDLTAFYGPQRRLLGFNLRRASEKNLVLSSGLNEPSEALVGALERITGLALRPYAGKIPFVVGKVVEIQQIPDSHLNDCAVDVGKEGVVRIVCGGTNVVAGMLVVVVLPGGMVADGREIARSKLFGRESAGMICSAAELDLPGDHAPGHVMKLPPDAAVGSLFTKPYNISK